jgi:hypothetical protein
MIGAMMIHGITPGPEIIGKQPGLFWGMVASMLIGNVILVILNLPMIGIWVKLLKVPYPLLFPTILVFCCVGAYTVDNSIEDVVIMVHLVEVPLSTWPGTKPTEVASESWPELENPPPDALIGDVEPALGQELFHVAVAQGEPEIQPDRVSDDLGWELMTGVGDGLHAPILLPPSTIRVTKPTQGRQARRPAGPAIDHIRAGRQSAHRQGARPHHSAVDPEPRRRGDRVIGRRPVHGRPHQYRLARYGSQLMSSVSRLTINGGARLTPVLNKTG